jgi:hypothetical protein
MRLMIYVGLMTVFSVSLADSSQAAPNLDSARSALLQGDGPQARSLLEAMQIGRMRPQDQTIRACMLARLQPNFALEPETDLEPGLPRLILSAYRRYWHAALIEPDRRELAEAALTAELRNLIGRPDLIDYTALTTELKSRMGALGANTVWGRTGLLYDFMLWKDQQTREFNVQLPGGSQRTTVYLLDDLPSAGWSRYATCGTSGTGGWATDQGLFAVMPTYGGTENEGFAINFLAHESQHFADYLRFPGLEAPELEYRAKLVELALADATRIATISRFTADQSDDRQNPHSFANKHVLDAIRARLGLAMEANILATDPAILRQTARQLLIEDDAARSSRH